MRSHYASPRTSALVAGSSTNRLQDGGTGVESSARCSSGVFVDFCVPMAVIANTGKQAIDELNYCKNTFIWAKQIMRIGTRNYFRRTFFTILLR